MFPRENNVEKMNDSQRTDSEDCQTGQQVGLQAGAGGKHSGLQWRCVWNILLPKDCILKGKLLQIHMQQGQTQEVP